MIRFLLPVIQLALLVYCLIECIQSDEGSVRNLGKTWWILLIIFVPVVGPIAWLVAGRPTSVGTGRNVPWPATQTAGFPEYERPRPPRGPDDDPAFLTQAGGPDPEHEYLLRQWEAQLREREEKLRGASSGDGSTVGDGSAAGDGSATRDGSAAGDGSATPDGPGTSARENGQPDARS